MYYTTVYDKTQIKFLKRNEDGKETAAVFSHRINQVFLQEFMMACSGIIHVVVHGDTLYLLSRKYHVPVTQLMYANPFVDIYNLTEGDELCIPVSFRKRENR